MTWQTIGFEKIKSFFERSLEEGLLNHAYIFSGEAMIGKKTFALELARMASGTTAEISPDLLFIDVSCSESKQSITIDEVRKIKGFVPLSPHSSIYKFVVVDDANLMTVEAQNALLKILEEPSKSSILILITANSASLLPTITSRCQEIKFPVHSKKTVAELLKNSSLPKNKTDFLAEFSSGKVGLVKNILNEKSLDEVEESVNKLMRLIKLDLNDRLTFSQKLTDDKSKANLPKLVMYWILYMRMRLDEPKAHKILRNLLDLYKVIQQPQFNQRLVLDNFLVQL